MKTDRFLIAGGMIALQFLACAGAGSATLPRAELGESDCAVREVAVDRPLIDAAAKKMIGFEAGWGLLGDRDDQGYLDIAVTLPGKPPVALRAMDGFAAFSRPLQKVTPDERESSIEVGTNVLREVRADGWLSALDEFQLATYYAAPCPRRDREECDAIAPGDGAILSGAADPASGAYRSEPHITAFGAMFITGNRIMAIATTDMMFESDMRHDADFNVATYRLGSAGFDATVLVRKGVGSDAAIRDVAAWRLIEDAAPRERIELDTWSQGVAEDGKPQHEWGYAGIDSSKLTLPRTIRVRVCSL